MTSSWYDRLTATIVPERARLWTVLDPDGLFLEPAVGSILKARGYEIVAIEDQFRFRYDYERRFRPCESAQWIVHAPSADEGMVPFDVLSESHVLHVNVAALFENLDPNVVKSLGTDRYRALDAAYGFQIRSRLSSEATKDFISANLFRFSPTAVRTAADFWVARFDLFFDGAKLPAVLAERASGVMALPDDLPRDEAVRMLIDDAVFVDRVQRDWDAYVAALAVGGQPAADLIPLEQPRIRRSLDTMVLDGVVRPAVASDPDGLLPAWSLPMVVADQAARRRLLERRIDEAIADVPASDADHRAWFAFARRYATIVSDHHAMEHEDRSVLTQRVATLRRTADEHLRAWLPMRYDDLASASPVRAPVMVHQVARHIEHRRSSPKGRTALIVMDGLALDQWLLLERETADELPWALIDAGAAFAWLPTLTSVSRQSIFAGAVPRTFAPTIRSTSAEPRQWKRFWTDAGLPSGSIFYGKGISSRTSVDELLSELTSLPEMVGVVVDVVDRMMHGTVLGKANLAAQIDYWLRSGAWTTLIGWLLMNDYEIYVTADHGNTDAVGVGRPNEGVAPLERGERVRAYDSSTLRENFLAACPSAFAFDPAGLPTVLLPAFAGPGEAFINRGEHVVTHGGASLEELIVPFVRISRKENA